ncbi:MAG: hypothetical protein HOJ35_09320 [Bdellovibrionales bacterium]|nr:hypothetical protein [Bdellovibrionales bacterium]
MKYYTQLLTIFILLMTLTSCEIKFWDKDSEGSSGNSNGNGNDDGSGTNLEACSDTNIFFSHSPVSIGDFMGIVPLGNLNPSGHTFPTSHLYFYIVNSDNEGPSDNVNFFASGDGVITSIRASHHITAGFTDYNIDLQPCSDFILQYGHVQTLSEKLQAKIDELGEDASSCQDPYETGGEEYQNCSYSNLKIEVTAGENLGTTGGVQNQYALDIGAVDYREIQNEFASEDMIDGGSDLFYKVCAIDYFEPGIKAEMEVFFGDYSGSTQRTIEPLCGDVVQEQAGTALGRWFKPGEDYYPEDNHLALVYDNVNPALGAVSAGDLFPTLYAHTFTIKNSGLVNRDFSNISPGNNVYCFDISNGRFLLKMEAEKQIKVEYQDLTNCSSEYSFTVASLTFVR